MLFMVAQLETAISFCLGLQSRSLLIPFCEELFPLLLLLRYSLNALPAPQQPALTVPCRATIAWAILQ